MGLLLVRRTAWRLRDRRFRPLFSAAGRDSGWIHNIAIYLAAGGAKAGRWDRVSLRRDAADARGRSCASRQDFALL